MADNTKKLKSITSNALKAMQTEADLMDSMQGKVMPQATPLEEAVLGAIMLDKDGFTSSLDLLKPECFYLEAHQKIYMAMQTLFDKSQPIDLLTVHEALKKSDELDEIGGPNYLMLLTNKVASAANIEFHARIVFQKYIQRELIRISTKTIKESFEDAKDVFDLLDEAEKGLYDITDNNLNQSYKSLSELAVRTQKEIEEMSLKGDGLTGVTTGFEDLDRLTGGWQPSDLIILAARPGMGKTAFVLSLAKNAAEAGEGVAIFSLEMPSNQLVSRLIAMDAEINSKKLRTGKLEDYEWDKLHSSVDKLSETPIYIDDTPGINIFEMRAKCRRLKNNHDIKMIVIDYLQLMNAAPNQKKGNREQEISSISRALKSLAKELSVPIIALSQLSRAVETRGGDKRPMLSDLRESGAIEQDADIVSFIYRQDYYGVDEEFEDEKDKAEVIIAKHRNGALDSVFLRFIPQFVKFTEGNWNQYQGDLTAGQGFVDPNAGFVTRSSRMNSDDGPDVPF